MWSTRASLASSVAASVALTGLIPLTAGQAAAAAEPPAPRAGLATSLITGGLSSPTSVASAYDGTSRLFVTESSGLIRVVKDGVLKPKPYLDLRSRVQSGGEQGLLGIAFHPNFKKKPVVYFSYTISSGALVVAKASAKSWAKDRAKFKTVRTVLTVPHPGETNHNGGSLTFGNDKLLYIGTGDGGGGGDPFHTAQNVKQLRGKILRINPKKECGSANFCVPNKNPWASGKGNKRLVWAKGVRNPWKMSTDPATGNLWVADVGQSKYEEISVIPPGFAGANLGWSCREGNASYNPDQCSDLARYIAPVLTLCQVGEVPGCPANRSGASIIGGYVYRGSAYPSLAGKYIFGDFISGNLYTFSGDSYAKTGELPRITSFGETSSRELVAVSYDGRLYNVRPS